MHASGRWLLAWLLIASAMLAAIARPSPLTADDPPPQPERLSLENDRGALPDRPGQHLNLTWEIAANRLTRHLQLTWGPLTTKSTLHIASSQLVAFNDVQLAPGLAVSRAEASPESGELRVVVELASPSNISAAALAALSVSRREDQNGLLQAWSLWATAVGKTGDQQRREVRRLRRAGSGALRNLRDGLVCLTQLVTLGHTERATLSSDALVAAAEAIDLEVPRTGPQRRAPVDHARLAAMLESRVRCVTVKAVCSLPSMDAGDDPNGSWRRAASIPVSFGETASAGQVRLGGSIEGADDQADWWWLPHASAADCSPVTSLPEGINAVSISNSISPLPMPGQVLVEAVSVKGRPLGMYLRVSRRTSDTAGSDPLPYTVIVQTSDAAGYTLFLEPGAGPSPAFPF